MTGGAGHVRDMQNRLDQNRQLRTSMKKAEAKPPRREATLGEESSDRPWQTYSPDRLAAAKAALRARMAKERRRERIILLVAGLFVLAMFAWLYVAGT